MPLAGLLLLGGAILGLFYLVPRTRPFGRFRPALLTVTGFILAQAGLSAAITALDLVPKGPFRDLLHEFTSYEGERPVVLLVGSSFSAAGVDPDALAAALGSSGTVPMVQSFAVGGAPHLERLYYLKEFLSRAKRKPQLVLFEIAGGYDNGPLYQVHEMRFSDRMVGIMDGPTAWWALRWVVSADGLTRSQRVTLGSEILAQLAFHLSHIGFFWNSAPVAEPAAPEIDVSPPPIRFSDERVAELLEQAATTRELKPEWPSAVPTNWMRAFLTAEIAALQRHGIQRFAFYSVPSMQGANVAYASRFCAAMIDFPCIIGQDPDLLARLRHGADWYDFDHLQGLGRNLFTRWFADRLVETGMWPP